jgi:long-chain acyl-CoA synthetase
MGPPVTMCEAFQATAARFPQQVALRAAGGAATITWGQYAARVRRIAAGLAGLGVGPGETVALMMTNRAEFHLVDTAAFHLGAAPFSVSSTLAVEQVRQVLAHAGSRMVVCERQFAPRLLAARPGTAVEHVACVDGRLEGMITLAGLEAARDLGPGFEACWRAVDPGDLLTVVYTPGATGSPERAEISHAEILAGLTAASPVVRAGPCDRAISYLPMARLAERYAGHYGAMFAGVQVTPLADATLLPGALQDIRPTIFAAGPREWEMLMAAADSGRPADQQVLSKIRFALGLDQVRIALCGADPGVLEFLHALGIAVAEEWAAGE